MSFIMNIFNNDTINYWDSKLKGKWYRIPFVLTKNLEINSFQSEMNQDKKYPDKITVNIIKSDKHNTINLNSKISVVVPTYIRNRRQLKQLQRLIKRLNAQTVLPHQIIIVNDCSPYEFNLDKNNMVTIINLEQNSGPANARNIGIEEALKSDADIIAFTDTDVVPSIDWLEEIRNTFINNRNTHIISGQTKSYNKTWLGKYHNINGTLNGRQFINSDLLLYGPTCNLAVIREALTDTKFSTDFPNAAGEDIDFCFELIHKGFNINHVPNVMVYHDYGYSCFTPRRNLRSFKKQFKRYALGEKILLERIPTYYSYLDITREISSIG